MTRFTFATLGSVACGILMAGVVLAQVSKTEFRSKRFSVTNIDPSYFSVQLDQGMFAFRGLPTLHAVLPDKHLTLDAAKLDGTVDSATGLLKTATLTGGVRGALDSPAKEGVDHFTFAGSTVLFTNHGAAGIQDGDFDISGGVAFGSSNVAIPRNLSVTGSHGLFKLRTIAGEVGLASADLEGPVTAQFSGVTVDKDNNKTPVAGRAKGGRLTIRRGGPAGTDYILRFSGGVEIRELSGPLGTAVATAPVVDMVLDAKGAIKAFSTEGSTDGTVGSGKPPE